MRIRSVKPEFWEDEDVAALPPLTRLYFIGLWNLADDAGYLRWSVTGVAAALFRYDTKRRRERAVTDAMDRLVAAGMAQIFDCGRHALVPNLTKHQHLAGETRRVHTYLREHADEDPRNSPPIPAESRGANPRTSPHIPATPRPRARGKVQVGEVVGSDVEVQVGGARSVPPRVAPRGSRSSPTNGAAIDDSIAMANDESAPDVARRAARRAVERHAPERLGEIGAAP